MSAAKFYPLLLLWLFTTALTAQRGQVTVTFMDGTVIDAKIVNHRTQLPNGQLNLQLANGSTQSYTSRQVRGFTGPAIGTYVSAHFEPTRIQRVLGDDYFLQVLTSAPNRLLVRRTTTTNSQGGYTSKNVSTTYVLDDGDWVHLIKEKEDVLRALPGNRCALDLKEYLFSAYELAKLTEDISACQGQPVTILAINNNRKKGVDLRLSAEYWRNTWRSNTGFMGYTDFDAGSRYALRLGITKSLGSRVYLTGSAYYTQFRQSGRSYFLTREDFTEPNTEFGGEHRINYDLAGLGVDFELAVLQTTKQKFLLGLGIDYGLAFNQRVLVSSITIGATPVRQGNQTVFQRVAGNLTFDSNQEDLSDLPIYPHVNIGMRTTATYQRRVGELEPFLGLQVRYGYTQRNYYNYREIGLLGGMQF